MRLWQNRQVELLAEPPEELREVLETLEVRQVELLVELPEELLEVHQEMAEALEVRQEMLEALEVHQEILEALEKPQEQETVTGIAQEPILEIKQEQVTQEQLET